MESTDEAREYGSELLTGSKVRLRELRDADLDQLVEWWNDPECAVLQAPTVLPQPASAVREQFQKWSENRSPTAVGFCVVSRETAELLGHVALHGMLVPARSAEFVITIGGQSTSRGLGSEAVSLMVRYGFEELNLNRIHLRVFGYNTRAIAAYRRAGFVEEGRERQVAYHGGRYHDGVLMSILAEEYWSG